VSEADPKPSKNGKLGILIVDDHPIVRQGIRLLMGEEEDLYLWGEAESAAEAIRAMADAESPPDLAIIDLTLKDSSGLELIKDFRTRWPDVLVLVLSMRDEAFYAERCLRAGAKGYVTKEEGPVEVLKAIRAIVAGNVHLSGEMATRVLRRVTTGGESTGMDRLTDRELEVFRLIGNGLATREVSERLHVSPKTVESHRERIKDKLGLDTANDLLKHAIQWVQCQQ